MPSNYTQHVGNHDFTRATVVIIGAGVSGMCMAIDLLHRTPIRKFVILEQGSSVGGTWANNLYPGCASDVCSSLYSYSFEQRPDWAAEYPGQEEFLTYMTDVAQKHGLYKYIRFNSTVQEARWDDQQQQWKVKVALNSAKASEFHEQYELTTDFLVSGVGQLNVPSYPSISGLDDYTGKLIHSARWDWTYDFSGKRIGVIGNGASAIQIVPELAKTASHITIYQRSPKWLLPRSNKKIGAIQHFLLSYVPPLRWCKRILQMRYREWLYNVLVTPGTVPARQFEAQSQEWMKSQLPDKPELWDTLTPNYAIGCKRVLISDDFYAALNASHVDLNTRPIQRITATGVQTDDDEQEYDLIVLATGFRASEFLHPIRVYGAGGRSLEDIWKDGPRAYYGMTVEDVPNFGMLYGPNTNLGHNSVITMIEAQSRYLSTMIRAVADAKKKDQTLVIQPRPEVLREYNERVQKHLAETSFADPNCQSWYKTAEGLITNNWPFTVVRYQKEVSQVRWADFILKGSGSAAVAKKKATYVGRVKEEALVSNVTLFLGVALAAGGVYWRATSWWKWKGSSTCESQWNQSTSGVKYLECME
ncbi:hypothetical protein CBS147345_7782 [Aspergillus niger]|nr:hypothetical protein CBS147345_7782 [Aspergillus niger]